MGENLNDALMFQGLICEFDKYDNRGPLPDGRLNCIIVRRRDAILLDRPLLDWTRDEILARLKSDGIAFEVTPYGGVDIPKKLQLFFADDGAAEEASIWVPRN